jgi:AcrR family transcriptional regulator
MATHRRRMPAAQRREVILAAAEDTFAEQGYHGASLDQIAHSAGVSKALIYEHFESKRELHASLLNQHAAEIFDRLETAAREGSTAEERLRTGIDTFLAFVEEHRSTWRALVRDSSEPEAADVLRTVQDRATGFIAALIGATGNGGERSDDPAGTQARIEVYAQMLSGAVQSLAAWWHAHPEVPRGVLVDRAMEFCWNGIERLPDRRHTVGRPG